MAKLRESIISNCEKKFVVKGLANYTRLDGRAFEEFRDVKIEFGKDWGCCNVALGKTRALAQVSCEVQQPNSARPSEGMININVELGPMAAPHFEIGRQTDLSVQINRTIEKCIKDSKAVDLEALCIKVNEKVWALRVDINILNNEGNIADCASIAALAAIAHFRRPDVTSDGEEIIIHSIAQRDPVPTVLHHYPVCVSYAVFNQGNIILADPTLLEENVADAHLNVGLNAYKELCCLHLGGNVLIDPQTVLQYTSKAFKRATEVINYVKQALEDDIKERDENNKREFCTTFINMQESGATEMLHSSLDIWETKRKRRNKKELNILNKDEEEINPRTIEIIDINAAALIPHEIEDKNGWTLSSDQESDSEKK